MKIEQAHNQLAELGDMRARTDLSERRILDAAEQRLETVNERMALLRPKSLVEASAGDEYQKLVEELGQLHVTIARAREALKAA